MRRSPLCALFALALGAALASPAAAHAEYESSTPASGETVAGSPDELVVRFTQDLDAARSSLVVATAAGDEVASGGEPGDDPRELRLALPELAPGAYDVRWTSWSAEDNEGHRGTFTFTVAPAPTPTPTTEPTPTPARSPTDSPTPTPTSTPTPERTSSPSPSPSTAPDGSSAGASDASLVLPIVAALVAVAALGGWLRRRRAA